MVGSVDGKQYRNVNSENYMGHAKSVHFSTIKCASITSQMMSLRKMATTPHVYSAFRNTATATGNMRGADVQTFLNSVSGVTIDTSAKFLLLLAALLFRFRKINKRETPRQSLNSKRDRLKLEACIYAGTHARSC